MNKREAQQRQENAEFNKTIIDYCRRVYNMHHVVPNRNELYGYILFQRPTLSPIATKAKVQWILKSSAYKKLWRTAN